MPIKYFCFCFYATLYIFFVMALVLATSGNHSFYLLELVDIRDDGEHLMSSPGCVLIL